MNLYIDPGSLCWRRFLHSYHFSESVLHGSLVPNRSWRASDCFHDVPFRPSAINFSLTLIVCQVHAIEDFSRESNVEYCQLGFTWPEILDKNFARMRIFIFSQNPDFRRKEEQSLFFLPKKDYRKRARGKNCRLVPLRVSLGISALISLSSDGPEAEPSFWIVQLC